MAFIPKLTTTDWNAEWMELQKTRRPAGGAEHWDERSKTYHKAAVPPSPYASKFIEHAGLLPGETVFDMGCGTGAISIPLVADGHAVCAADFSEGMLGVLQSEAARIGSIGGIGGLPIEAKLLDWEDDWEAKGVLPGSFDVATASRSIATADLRSALKKLSQVARRRCAITLPTGTSPRTDESILSAVGLQRLLGRDYVYAVVVLVEMGFFPEVRYIPSARHDTFASEGEARTSLEKMVVDAAQAQVPEKELEEALSRLKGWVSANLEENPDAGKVNRFGETEGALRLKEPRKITWAHIAWNVR